MPFEARSCYSGPPETAGIGICEAGLQTCTADGTAWGACGNDIVPKIEDCTTFDDEDCDGSSYCVGAVRWSRRFGNVEYDAASGVAVDNAGHILLAGQFSDHVTFDAFELQSTGNTDIFLAELDTSGKVIWAKSFGGSNDENGGRVAFDTKGNIVLTGSLSGVGPIDLGGQCGTVQATGGGDIFVAKLDAEGTCLWSHAYGDANYQLAIDMALDSEDDILLAGRFVGDIAFGPFLLSSADADTDAFVAKLDSSGSMLWAKGYGDVGEQGIRSISVTPQNEILLAGYLMGAINVGGPSLQSAGSYDAFLLKLTPLGGFVWGNRYGDQSEQQAYAVSVAPSGDIIVTGGFKDTLGIGTSALQNSGDEDVFVGELTADGESPWWLHGYGDSAAQNGKFAQADALGNVLLIGEFESTIGLDGTIFQSTGGYNSFVTKFDSFGNQLWARAQTSTGGMSVGYSVVDNLGSLYVVGSFSGSAQLGNGTLLSTGNSDAFIVAFAP